MEWKGSYLVFQKKITKTKYLYILQFSLCTTAEHLDCVSSIQVDISECLQQCSGVMVTSKTENSLLSVVSEMVEYLKGNRYMKGFEIIAKEFPGFLHS